MSDLKNTRPITLLETLRKILIKILTNRISQTCTNSGILKGDNFLVLKDTSTATPIHIVNFLIEHTTNHKKKLWLVSQDMKKAYDSVGTDQLLLALKRINMHPKYIELIQNIQQNHTNSVQTFFGPTDEYSVQDGLDQGEVNVPIHWRIFYDPLLAEIKRLSKKNGYKINTKWTQINRPKEQMEMKNFFTGYAFMDNTL